MRNINIALPDETHQRLRDFAWVNRMTMADALRFVLDRCLPAVPSKKKASGHNDDGEARGNGVAA